MAHYVTSINGMGSAIIDGLNVVTEGMRAEDHMHFSEDFIDVEGVRGASDFLVTQRGAGANKSVDVAGGVGYVLNSSYSALSATNTRFWRDKMTATENVVIADNASGNPRIDVIALEIDTGASPDDEATNVGQLVVIQGTPAASPTAPSLDANQIKLAQVAVANGFTSITNANITDYRKISQVKLNDVDNGWLYTNEQLVYVSSSSIKIVGVDRTSKYGVGTRLKFTQTTGGTKQFEVVSASFSTDTTINLIGINGATVANETITSPFFSRQYAPVGKDVLLSNDWTPSSETWNYSSVDDPTGVITISGDYTSKYRKGMRIRFVNGGNTILGIISDTPTYSAPNTTIKFLHQIDPSDSLALVLMANSAITFPYYSAMKVPSAFPIEPQKWTFYKKDTSDRAQASPTADVWYNPGGVSLNIPIGDWDVRYQVYMDFSKNSATNVEQKNTLSTANNSQSDPDFTSGLFLAGASGNLRQLCTMGAQKKLTLTAKTTYYLNILTSTATSGEISIRGDLSTTVIECVSTLL